MKIKLSALSSARKEINEWAHWHQKVIRVSASSSKMGLSPSPQWVASLPGGKLPDRLDFKRYGDHTATRIAVWRRARLRLE